MCMNMAIPGQYDAQNTIGKMIGGSFGGAVSDASVSGMQARHPKLAPGSETPKTPSPVQTQALQQTETRQARQGKSLLSS